jgi:ParB-like chromosome segregation protein Spo0J
VAARRTNRSGEVFDLPVHPLAAIFPLMADDELNELAEDIAQNGLIHPIVIGEWVDEDGEVIEGIIDGRNRLAACRLAGVEPSTSRLNGEDPASFIVSVNLARRNLTKGQQAMALAMIYPEAPRGRGHKDPARSALKGAETASFRRLQEARAVLRDSRELAEAVIAGKPLDEALKEVSAAQHERQSFEWRLSELRREAPDVADLVVEERLTLEAGMAELAERRKLEEVRRENLLRASHAVIEVIAWTHQTEIVDRLCEDREFRRDFIKRLGIDPAKDDVLLGAKKIVEVLELIEKLEEDDV